MLKFLPGDEIAPSIRSILADTSEASLGVAFWGEGATRRLGLDDSGVSLRILCDARSGACNTDELLHLIRRPNTKIRARDGFHAKTYLTASRVVLGSANASANGLGLEDDEITMALETALMTDDPRVVQAAQSWFDANWNEAVDVDADFAERYRGRHTAMRQKRPWPLGAESLLGSLRAKPTSFKDRPIYVLVYDYDEKDYQKLRTVFDALDANQYTKQQRDQYIDTHPLYRDLGRLKPNDYVIDFTIEEKPRSFVVMHTGTWRVRTESWRVRVEKQNVVLTDRVKEIAGIRIRPQDIAVIRDKVREMRREGTLYRETGGGYSFMLMPLYEFYTRYLAR